MKKIYKSKLHSLSFAIRVDGKYLPIEFKPGVITQYGHLGCTYTTTNKAVADILDSLKQCKSGEYWGEVLEEDEPVEAPKAKRTAKKG